MREALSSENIDKEGSNIYFRGLNTHSIVVYLMTKRLGFNTCSSPPFKWRFTGKAGPIKMKSPDQSKSFEQPVWAPVQSCVCGAHVPSNGYCKTYDKVSGLIAKITVF